MDAVEFIMKRERMCKPNIAHCESCPVDIEMRKRGLETTCYNFQITYPKTFVEIVEQWDKEHPIKTRQSEFLKLFPDAFVYQGSIDIDPCKIVKSKFDTEQCKLRKTSKWSCENCRKQFWHEEGENGRG